MSFVNMAYATYSTQNPVKQNPATTNNTNTTGTNTGNNFNTTAPTGMSAGVVDWATYDTQIAMMHNRLSGNNEEEALEMRQQMAQSIMNAYNSDADETNDITMEQALSYVDARYQQVTGQSIITTIDETTKSANSFWNYVPIVNWFIDDTSAEDLYDVMEGKEANTKDKENKGGAWANIGGCTAVGAGIGTAFCPGIGSAVGAGIGFVVGGITELFDNWF
jgi:hypothetical protein